MKDDPIYSYYLFYIEEKLNYGRISKGAFSLLKISKSYFYDFKHEFENNELFNKKMIELFKCEMRDKKIDDIFDDID